MKITKIELQKKGQRFNLEVDGNFVCSISATTLTHYNLYKDKDLKEEELEIIVNKEIENRFFDRVVSLLSSRLKTEKQVETYLYTLYLKKKNKWFNELENRDIVFANVIERVRKLGLINDDEYARSFVTGRIRSKPRGFSQIISELLSKGIKKEIASRIVSELITSNEDLIETVYKKKFKDLPLDLQNRKIVDFLLRKGFDWDDISKLERKLKDDTTK